MRTALDFRAVLTLILLCGSWGLNQVAIKVTLAGIPPAFQMGFRSAVAALVVLFWCSMSGRKVFDRDGTLWPGLAVGALFGAEFLSIYWGLRLTTAARGVIFMYLSPFVVAIGGHFLLGERLGARKLVGLACAFLGLVIAFSDKLSLPSPDALFGDALCILAALLWGATTLLIKRSALRTASAEKTLLYQLAVSAVIGIVVGIWLREKIETPFLIAVLPTFFYQAIWVAAITYIAWFALVRDYPASLVTSFTFLTPLFGVAFGAALLNEPVSSRLIVALLLVAAGIYLVNRAPLSYRSQPA